MMPRKSVDARLRWENRNRRMTCSPYIVFNKIKEGHRLTLYCSIGSDFIGLCYHCFETGELHPLRCLMTLDDIRCRSMQIPSSIQNSKTPLLCAGVFSPSPAVFWGKPSNKKWIHQKIAEGCESPTKGNYIRNPIIQSQHFRNIPKLIAPI